MTAAVSKRRSLATNILWLLNVQINWT